MTTFDLLLEDRGAPPWLMALVSIGFLLLTILCLTASYNLDQKAGPMKESGLGNFFGFLGALALIFTFVSFIVVDSVNQEAQVSQVREQLVEMGYENIDLTRYGDTFVASKDGRYVSGDVLKKSYTEIVVVVRSQ